MEALLDVRCAGEGFVACDESCVALPVRHLVFSPSAIRIAKEISFELEEVCIIASS